MNQIGQLTQDDLRQADEIVAEIERWFQSGNDRYAVNTLLDTRAPVRVWWEVVARGPQAGWDVWFRGTMVTARRRRQSAVGQPRE